MNFIFIYFFIGNHLLIFLFIYFFFAGIFLGIKFYEEKYLISVSIDQQIILWNISHLFNSERKFVIGSDQIQKIDGYFHSIADVSSLCLIDLNYENKLVMEQPEKILVKLNFSFLFYFYFLPNFCSPII